jgi:hypothetical protein
VDREDLTKTMQGPNGSQFESGLEEFPRLSAFQPYSLAKERRAFPGNAARGELVFESSNPFMHPADLNNMDDPLNMDDISFGEHFDAMRRECENIQGVFAFS